MSTLQQGAGHAAQVRPGARSRRGCDAGWQPCPDTRGERGGQGSGPAPGMRAMNTDTHVPSSLQTHTHTQLWWQFLWTQGLHGPPLFRGLVRIPDVQDAVGLGPWL